MPSSAGMATISTTTSATPAPTPSSTSCAGVDQRAAGGYSQRFLSGRAGPVRHSPAAKPHLPIYFGGSSEAAIAVAGKHADVFALWGESLAQTGETIQRVRAEAAKHQRDIGFSVSFRPIIADSEAEAQEKAEHILHVATEQAAQRGGGFKAKPDSIGAQRLRATAAQGRVVDKRLWTGIAQLVGGGHNSTALVGTPEQVADALLDYYDLGVRNFLIRGFDPLNDAADYGRALLPIAREKPRGVRWRSAHRDPS